MTFEEIKASEKEMLTPADVADVLGCDKYTINRQAAEDIETGKNNLRFNYSRIGTRIKIPRRAFIAFMESPEF